MAKKQPTAYGEKDLCYGYVNGRTGVNGVCICGLYWEGHMPPHNVEGKLIPPYVLEREIKRKGRQLEVDLRRNDELQELERTSMIRWRR